MFTEVVKLTPQLDKTSLASMFKTLNQRFSDVAKKFGAGMKGAMRLGPLAAVAGVFLAKLLNPLQRAEEIIDRIINKGDDAITNAEEFGADPGKLLKLEGIAQAKGVDAATLRTLLGKFQGALAQETEKAKDPKAQPGILREFISETDTAEAFFSFIQSMQKLEKSRQVVVQQEVFGDRIRGRASEFFNASDLGDLLKMFPDSQTLSQAATKTGALSDQKDLNNSIRELQDFVTKSKLVSEGMIKDIDTSARQKDRADNETLKRYDQLKSTSIAVQELTAKFDSFATDMIQKTAPLLVDAINNLTSLVNTMMPYLTTIADWTATAFNGTIDAIARISVAMETYWSEFKTSRVYKFFGGGGR